MDGPERLSDHPFAEVRVICHWCSRRGRYRLARLAAHYGPEITLDELVVALAADCRWAWRKGEISRNKYVPPLPSRTR